MRNNACYELFFEDRPIFTAAFYYLSPDGRGKQVQKEASCRSTQEERCDALEYHGLPHQWQPTMLHRSGQPYKVANPSYVTVHHM